MDADYEECRTAAREAKLNVANPYIDYNQSTASVAGASMAAGFMKGMEKAKLRRQVNEACLNKKGYTKTWITDEEYESFKSAKEEGEESTRVFLHKIASEKRDTSRFIDPDNNK